MAREDFTTESAARTANELVAANLILARRVRGWTQDEAAQRLEPFIGARWSRATWSDAERSAYPDHRTRQFTADDLVAFSQCFGLPLMWWFLPLDPKTSTDFEAVGATDGMEHALTPLELIDLTYQTDAALQARLASLAPRRPGLPGRDSDDLASVSSTIEAVIGELDRSRSALETVLNSCGSDAHQTAVRGEER